MSTSPAAHPEWSGLLAKRDALQFELAEVLTDLHALDDGATVVLGRYAAAFGDRLATLHELEIEAARLKREIELVQAALNVGHDIDYNQIQETLEAEFAEWQEKLRVQAANLDSQKAVLENLMDPEICISLRNRYRALARRLHPDVNPGQSPAAAELWHRVVAAYEACDIEKLEVLEIVSRDAGSEPAPDTMEELRALVFKLRERLDQWLTRIMERRQAWPFDQLPALDDPGALAARQSELDERIAFAQTVRDHRRQWLNGLLDH